MKDEAFGLPEQSMATPSSFLAAGRRHLVRIADVGRYLTCDSRRIVFESLGVQRLSGRTPDRDGWIDDLLLPKAIHIDTNPSFSVNLLSGACIDHGGHFKGDLWDLVGAVRHCSIPEAIEWVCDTAGIRIAPPVSVAGTSVTPTVADRYDYTDRDGQLLFQVVRYQPKDFRQRHRTADGRWRWGRDDVEPVLYRLPAVLTAAKRNAVVYVVEGEKDVHSLESIGLVGTCSPGGAGKWKPSLHVPPLIGCNVVVIADNDRPGQDHAEQVARSLVKVASSVRVIDLPGVPIKGDVTDWLRLGGTAGALEDLASQAPEWTPTDHNVATEPLLPGSKPTIGIRLVDVERERIEWIWPGRLPRGKLVVLDGDPGVGKSTLVADIAARLTGARQWPDGTECGEAGVVAYVTVEDDPGDTIRPRMEEAGADLRRVVVVPTIDDGSGPRPPVLTHDVERLMSVFDELPDGPRLLVVDPLMGHLGNVNSYRDQDVRSVMGPVAEAAARYNVTVLVVRHLTKMVGGSAMYRGGGSIGIIGAARVGLVVGRDPVDEEIIVLATTKSNIAQRISSYAFRLVSSPRDPDVGIIQWVGPSSRMADELVARPTSESGTPILDEASHWLMAKLACGPRLSSELLDEAEQANIKRKTLYRAKAAIGVRARKFGFGSSGAWEWSLPLTTSADADLDSNTYQ